jgi:hypothetical protein
MANFKIESTIIINGTNFAKATSAASRLSSRGVGLREEGNTALAKQTAQLAQGLYSALETGIATTMGAKKIAEVGGRGLKVDLIRVNFTDSTVYTTEIKSSLIRAIKERAGSGYTATRKGPIDIGSAIKIGSSGTSALTVGYSASEGVIKENVSANFSDTEGFALFYSKNGTLFNQHLLSPDSQPDENYRKILTAVSKNLETKALTLSIPFVLNYRQTAVTTLQFTKDFILKNAKAKFNASTNNLEITFAYPQSVINDALKIASSSPEVIKGYEKYGKNFDDFMDKKIKTIGSKPNSLDYFKNLIESLDNSITEQALSFDLNYVKGSVVAYNSIVKVQRASGSAKTQLSILDITMLVRGRTKLKMRRGSAAPSPPKIYERSGAFRGSIEAVANMNTNVINYFYTPYYDALQRYGYTIQDMVEGSIRDIARERLGGQFILRKNTQTII